MNNVLGPRNLGGILGEMFGIYGRNFLRLLAIVAIVQVVLDILGPILMLPAIAVIIGKGGIASLSLLIPVGIILVAGSIIGYPLMGGALIHAISEQHFQQPVSISQAYRYAWRRIKALIGGILSTPIAITVATLLYYDIRVRKEGYSLEALAGELQTKINSSVT